MDTLFDLFKRIQNNPYIFAKHSQIASRTERVAPETLSSGEEAVLKEQHRILFAHDTLMRDLFDDNFEEYFTVIQKPDLFTNKIKSFVSETNKDVGVVDVRTYTEAEAEAEDADILSSVAQDPLFKNATAWTEAIRAITALYPGELEAFRLLANAQLVPSKIVAAYLYSYSYMDEDEDEESDAPEIDARAAEAELHQYTLANIFLSRSRESLRALSGVIPERSLRYLQTHAESIATLLRDRMLECAALLQER